VSHLLWRLSCDLRTLLRQNHFAVTKRGILPRRNKKQCWHLEGHYAECVCHLVIWYFHNGFINF
jgi:hypothetical protein